MSAPRWVPIGHGAALFLTPAGRRYAAECARIAHSRGVRIDDDHLEEITAEALAKVVLLDWTGVSIGGETEATYTPERGKDVLLRSPRFRQIVLEGAEEQVEFDQKLIEETSAVLRWNLRWGESIETLYRHKEKFGETPKALLERPEMTLDQRAYLDSFHILSKFRGSNGFGPSPLHYADVVDFADRLGYESGSESMLFFIEMMATLDGEYLKYVNEKHAATAKKTTTTKRRR